MNHTPSLALANHTHLHLHNTHIFLWSNIRRNSTPSSLFPAHLFFDGTLRGFRYSWPTYFTRNRCAAQEARDAFRPNRKRTQLAICPAPASCIFTPSVPFFYGAVVGVEGWFAFGFTILSELFTFAVVPCYRPFLLSILLAPLPTLESSHRLVKNR